MARNTVFRSLHDVGLAAWFGGTLANAVALNAAAAEADTSHGTGRVANAGWDRWTPVNAAAIGAHLVGSVGLLGGNRDRLQAQQGVAAMSVLKTALTAGALGVTAYSRALGARISAHTHVAAESGTEPSAHTPPDVATAQKQLAMLQWAVPVLTGALVVVSAFAGEQQRPSEVHKGLMSRLSG
jgi:hypothetical protein